jgi:hypothetical protein
MSEPKLLTEAEWHAMNEYHLLAYIPYECPLYLFTGPETDLKDFIQRNSGIKIYTTVTGRKIESTTISGYMLDDLEILIQGPDVRTYLE